MGVTPPTLPYPVDIYLAGRFAIVWSTSKSSTACRTPGWPFTQPLVDMDFGGWTPRKWFTAQCEKRNPGIALRASGLVGMECDGPEDKEILRPIIERLQLRPLLIEQSSGPGKNHLFFRRPRELGPDEDTSFRVEGGQVTGATGNLYWCAPTVSPKNGVIYKHTYYAPDAPALTEAQYQALVEWERGCAREQREWLRNGEPLQEGSRRNSVFRFACMLFRWSDDLELVTRMADTFQQATCEPQLEYGQVAHQVTGAWRVRGREGSLRADLEAHQSAGGTLTPLRLGRATGRFAAQLAKWVGDSNVSTTILRQWLKAVTNDAEAEDAEPLRRAS